MTGLLNGLNVTKTYLDDRGLGFGIQFAVIPGGDLYPPIQELALSYAGARGTQLWLRRASRPITIWSDGRVQDWEQELTHHPIDLYSCQRWAHPAT